MLNVQLNKQAAAFLGKIPTKHARQIAERITALRSDPASVLSEDLKGFAPFRRFKSGEYRVVFFIDESTQTLHIPIIGKRNDDEIYKQIARFQR
jgi:mRNA interferase RelE/StbE